MLNKGYLPDCKCCWDYQKKTFWLLKPYDSQHKRTPLYIEYEQKSCLCTDQNSLTGFLLWFMAEATLCLIVFMTDTRHTDVKNKLKVLHNLAQKTPRFTRWPLKDPLNCSDSILQPNQNSFIYFQFRFSLQHSSSKHRRCLVFVFCGSILDNLGLCSRHCEIHPALVNEPSYTKISIIALGVCQSTYAFVWYLKKHSSLVE